MTHQKVLRNYINFLCKDLYIVDNKGKYYTFYTRSKNLYWLRYGKNSSSIYTDENFVDDSPLYLISDFISTSHIDIRIELIYWMEEQIQKHKNGESDI